MDELVAQFLDFTGASDPAVAQQYLELAGNSLEYAVQLFLEGGQAGNDDEQLAQRLQTEAYDDVREADANVHRHETLVDEIPTFNPRPTDIFGAGRVGVFNQRFDEDENEFYMNEPEIIDLDSDSDEQEPPRSRRRINRETRMSELTSTQQRLANLFRPPFDIMEKCDIDSAKTLGRQNKKWILVNIQDATEFICQVLNRDFWSNPLIKNKVKENFIFLQYQHDSPNGEQYVNFYHVNSYPHIAILDPLTGERVHRFVEGSVPDVDEWLQQVDEFLGKFSLFGDNNPIVKHEERFDPDALTEEQQIEYALKQSVEQSTPVDPFESIPAQDHNVDDTTEPTTRLQIRFPNGKRLVHKFKLTDTIQTLYLWLKFVLSEEEYGIGLSERFVITNTLSRGTKLIESLDQTIEEGNLKNASILLEKE